MGTEFPHERLDNDIVNPIYVGDLSDDQPAFIHDDENHFSNPVYESMFVESGANGVENGIHLQPLCSNGTQKPDEKRELLRNVQDEMNPLDQN